jgi:hypothetical protein
MKGSDAIWSGKSVPTFQAKLLPPSSRFMIKTAGFSDSQCAYTKVHGVIFHPSMRLTLAGLIH